MLQGMLRAFAAERLRPAALAADAACAPPAELLAEGAELGIAMLSVPEALGGVQAEASAVTCVLAAEALAHGDMGLAVALLAPAGVAAALTLWGDERQQAAYLPAFTGDASRPPRSRCWSRARCSTRSRSRPAPAPSRAATPSPARRRSCRAPRTPSCCSSPPASTASRRCSWSSPGARAASTCAPPPAMGVRAAATGDVRSTTSRVPAESLLAGGDPAAYADCVRRARLAWCAMAVGTARPCSTT